MDLKERISKIIAYSELSLSEFADEIEVQRSSISHITSGRNKPSLDFLMKIKNRFPELEWEWLIEGKGEMLIKIETPEEIKIIPEKPKTTSLPDLFSLINDESFGVTESEDKIKIGIPRESNIPEHIVETDKISDSQRLEIPESKSILESVDKQEVKVKRIVLFYENGKFETFEP
ncbi:MULTISPECIES: helix-turn-helix domain-containing protein [unclassified Kaistella]|uniref:helix-turn-helix domain-containing protein n=1 Tax=unclassified Kaistella TaxID=2762626 RepID=UPI00273599D2|nr:MULTISPECIES: helix-turn-helix transcriptional regulator [unclassified Kaistella]MDP2454036.1 helix-turn-helix transcriptional regulator [Kaistella sp. SH11-4b]MDP2457093.1 helix-turn-helix transcriptional regulator [Kaistella sp. SH40-3]MDP2459851.1 helix-turn-helix transcriptional regulator [Kaistella sp. SH19-2b]